MKRYPKLAKRVRLILMICLAPLILVFILFGEYKRSSLIYMTDVQVHPTTDGSLLPQPRNRVSEAVDGASYTESWLGRRWPLQATVSLRWDPDDATRVRSELGPVESLRTRVTISETKAEAKWVQRTGGMLELLVELERPKGFKLRNLFTITIDGERGTRLVIECKVTIRNYIFLRFKGFTMTHVSWA